MAYSTCAKCGGTHFEIRENSPVGGNYKVEFVQCSMCGTVVGVLEYFNAGSLLQRIEKMLIAIAKRLGV